MVEDVVFLRRQEKKLHDTLCNASDEAASDKADRGAWNTNEPFLRLYNCIFTKEAREALMNMNNTMNRPELDAWNSDENILRHCMKLLPGFSTIGPTSTSSRGAGT
jgi:hypothetical protein